MSAEFAILLAVLTLGSCYASYRLGQEDIIWRMRKLDERRRERHRRWSEFCDEED